jgi:hypothetical protein
MKIIRIIAFIFIILFTSYNSFSQIYLIGPTLHYNIGGEKNCFSWGIEFSYWNWEKKLHQDAPPIGIDVGIDISKGRKRIYSEIQAGIGIGASLGYVYEISNTNYGGLQCSIWASCFGGLELRYRRMNNLNFFSPGGRIKIPINSRYPKLKVINISMPM